MAESNGEQLAMALLGAMPAPMAERILSRMGPVADRLRPKLATLPKSTELLDAALAEFFDIHRILERGYLAAASRAEAAEKSTADAATTQATQPSDDPIEELRRLSPDRLLRALDGEPPSAIAQVLGCLDAEVAGTVLKGLPAEVRADVAMRFSQAGPRNYALVNAIAKVVAEKGNALSDQPETKTTDRLSDLATMLRGLPRDDRMNLLKVIETNDADLATKLRSKLFRFTDLLKVEDRPLQQLLLQINLRTLASALRGAEAGLSEKVLKNISARARDQFNEELEALGNLSSARVQEAQDEIVQMLRQFEEEGKITLEE